MGEPEQHADERGLSGTVRTEIAKRATSRDAKLHVVHGDIRAEALRQSMRLDRPLALRSLILVFASHRAQTGASFLRVCGARRRVNKHGLTADRRPYATRYTP